MNQFERFKNQILAKFDTSGKKFKDFSRLVGSTFMEATANEKVRDNEFRKYLEEVTGFHYPATLSVGIANHSRGNNASPELAIALYFLCKIDPTYQPHVSKIEQKLLGRGNTFSAEFKWHPEDFSPTPKRPEAELVVVDSERKVDGENPGAIIPHRELRKPE